MNDLIEIGKDIIMTLKKNGYQGFFVGGIVRDHLINRDINDIDITTDARTDDIIKIFPKVIPTGIKHGTVTIISNGLPIEVTTFRRETNYSDYRHPETVEFVTNLYEDLSRRDFTINSMAMDESLNIIDPYKGQEALLSNTIETVGRPEERFREDPLRILRAIRFAAQLNFRIETLTWQKLVENVPYLKHIAVERVKIELDKIISSLNPSLGFELIKESKLLNWIKGLSIIEMNCKINYYNLLNRADDPTIRWFLILKQFNDTERNDFIKALKFSNKEITELDRLFISYMNLHNSSDNLTLKKCLVENGIDQCLRAIKILALLEEITEKEREGLTDYVCNLDKMLVVRDRKDLKITGEDLINHFKEPGGSWVKVLLDKLLELVIYQQETNDFSNLLNKALMIRKESDYEGKD